jgi:hypothetical protein
MLRLPLIHPSILQTMTNISDAVDLVVLTMTNVNGCLQGWIHARESFIDREGDCSCGMRAGSGGRDWASVKMLRSVSDRQSVPEALTR